MAMTKIDSKLRHEYKCRISQSDKAALISRLSLIMSDDPHYGREPYHIRSLYFDNVYDKALTERMNGQQVREKFRIRYYNSDSGYIMLEKKSKYGSMCGKLGERIDKEDVQRLINGDISWLKDRGTPLCRELYTKMQCQLLRPKVIVDYTRKAFVYPVGNVRVTLDYDIRTGLSCTDMFGSPVMVPADITSPVILEIKYDAFLPSLISDAVGLDSSRISSFSKYETCRLTNY